MPYRKPIRIHRTQRRRARMPRHGEKGQSLVEAAALFPILILLLAVIIEAARVFDAYIVLTNAAREGARYASLEPEPLPTQIQGLVVDDVQGSGTNITHMSGFDISNVEIISNTNLVTVTADYTFTLWFGGIVGIDRLHLEKAAVMPRGEW
jgi:Flp pilus assembly protein TadG